MRFRPDGLLSRRPPLTMGTVGPNGASHAVEHNHRPSTRLSSKTGQASHAPTRTEHASVVDVDGDSSLVPFPSPLGGWKTTIPYCNVRRTNCWRVSSALPLPSSASHARSISSREGRPVAIVTVVAFVSVDDDDAMTQTRTTSTIFFVRLSNPRKPCDGHVVVCLFMVPPRPLCMQM